MQKTSTISQEAEKKEEEHTEMSEIGAANAAIESN